MTRKRNKPKKNMKATMKASRARRRKNLERRNINGSFFRAVAEGLSKQGGE